MWCASGRRLTIWQQQFANFAVDKFNPDGFVMMVTAERSFDPTGWVRLPAGDRFSTLLTPSGLPIEGDVKGATTTRVGLSTFKSPYDQLVRVPLTAARRDEDRLQFDFATEGTLPSDLPPGIYRLRLDYGFTAGSRYYSLQARTFATYGFSVYGKVVESSRVPTSRREFRSCCCTATTRMGTGAS